MNEFPGLVFQAVFVAHCFSLGFDERMHFNPHQTGTTAQKSKGKTLFVVPKSHRDNGQLMLDSQSECAVFKMVQKYRFIVRNAAFGENTNAESLIDSFLGTFKNAVFASGTGSIDQNTGSFVEKSKQGNFDQFLFPHKNKRFSNRDQHQHNIDHRSMIGNKHITLVLFEFLFSFDFVIKSHPEKNESGPNSGHFKEIGITTFGQDGQDQKRKHQQDGNGHQNVKPNPPKHPKNNFYSSHKAKSK